MHHLIKTDGKPQSGRIIFPKYTGSNQELELIQLRARAHASLIDLFRCLKMPCAAECTTSTRSCVQTNVSILRNYQCLCLGLHFSYQCAVVINVKLYIININCCYGGLE